MSPVEVSATAAATPETIWKTCFEPMKWESWDPDLKETRDTEVGCKEGATCTFVMNDGNVIPVTLSNVQKNKSLNFSGGLFGGILKFVGKVSISPVDSASSKIEYSFALNGLIGPIISFLKKDDVVGGTQGGLDNMVKLSEEAQKN
ncbi:hypothetical protein HJC23_004516 [Cyclotella cryptica]|uniref:Polyketide cyclase/dehydrase n=1 Tax=Cyclotella cryptica TaxID=29204 RepID=A0ABD3NXX2_9STRA|eukprot:CCRYP_019017-RC/>CCRYP_019017-RC protein AED:0.37 eAED:0.37 QI:259/1/1/1/0.5/0.33/3/579/145